MQKQIEEKLGKIERKRKYTGKHKRDEQHEQTDRQRQKGSKKSNKK